jgi:hypothetical protein
VLSRQGTSWPSSFAVLFVDSPLRRDLGYPEPDAEVWTCAVMFRVRSQLAEHEAQDGEGEAEIIEMRASSALCRSGLGVSAIAFATRGMPLRAASRIPSESRLGAIDCPRSNPLPVKFAHQSARCLSSCGHKCVLSARVSGWGALFLRPDQNDGADAIDDVRGSSRVPDGLANAAHAIQRRKPSVYGRLQLTQGGEGGWPRSARTYDPAPVNRAVPESCGLQDYLLASACLEADATKSVEGARL